jgi:HrpA-like RNA helicase
MSSHWKSSHGPGWRSYGQWNRSAPWSCEHNSSDSHGHVAWQGHDSRYWSRDTCDHQSHDTRQLRDNSLWSSDHSGACHGQDDVVPTSAVRENIRQVLDQGNIMYVDGATGSGKSTTLPWYVLSYLNEKYDVRTVGVCTTPRRMPAITIAKRVAEGNIFRDNAPRIGDVGYGVGGQDSELGTRLNYVTHGYFLQRYQTHKDLLTLDLVVIDEIHERDVETDLVCWLVREFFLRSRSQTVVVLMSATMDLEELMEYFDRKGSSISIGNSAYLVNVVYLDDISGIIHDTDEVKKLSSQQLSGVQPSFNTTLAQITCSLILAIAKHGETILVFLPGLQEIAKMMEMLSSQVDKQEFDIHVLHSSIPPEDIDLACQDVQSHRKRVILASSIAESGVTIPTVSSVIDSGITRKPNAEDLLGFKSHRDGWCSQAVAIQRQGRTGRCGPGVVYRLYRKEIFSDRMQRHEVPVRTLARTSSAIMIAYVNLHAFGKPIDIVKDLLEVPSEPLLDLAMKQLSWIGALQPGPAEHVPIGTAAIHNSQTLTAFGKFSVAMPVGSEQTIRFVLCLLN